MHWVKIPVGRGKTLVLQNISDVPLQWTPDKNAADTYYLRAGEFLKVNYDVWVKMILWIIAYSWGHRGDICIRIRIFVPNKTDVQNKTDAANLTTTLAVINEFPELTIPEGQEH
ncbi:MAG: hypothetical protein H0A75_07940 [Candidatus Methanofishera endochildressiae]|uniref:Uncharacterized protein n=1 Tax=Candidatus Methanofishera endochildressiae TaxID=2738884 RepID=A0A7Z0MPL7_9GAMM|nr:hypothetical protein [Candidatus Methanofishera endochildressiae]